VCAGSDQRLKLATGTPRHGPRSALLGACPRRHHGTNRRSQAVASGVAFQLKSSEPSVTAVFVLRQQGGGDVSRDNLEPRPAAKCCVRQITIRHAALAKDFRDCSTCISPTAD
jgi:hypothetical protein